MTGKEVVPLIYNDAEDFSDGMAAVSTTYQHDLDDWGIIKVTAYNTGFVDKTGKEVIPLIYDDVSGVQAVSDFGGLGDVITTKKGFSEGLVAVHKKDGKWGVIDKQGNTVIPFTYDSIGGFSQGLASVYVNGKYGYIDKHGNLVIPAIYEVACDFSEGFAQVGRKDSTGFRYGFINKQGKLIAPMEYENMGAKFSEGLIKVATPTRNASGEWVGWKWGFLNTEGALVIPMIYYSVNMFSEGLSVVDIPEGWTGPTSSAGTHKYGVINKQGNVVIPLQTEYINSFSEGLAAVGSTPVFPKYHYIDQTGTTVISKTANQYGLSVFSGGIAVAYNTKSGTYSIIKTPLSTSQVPTTAPTVPTDTTPSFTDVPAGEWYADPVAWAVEKGITAGTTPTTFSPNQDCTHVQILTFLWRAANKPSSTATIFSDLAGDYAPAANWAYAKGMIGKSFNPNAACTRSQAVNYIWQALGKPSAKTSTFTDVLPNASYAKAVDWAVGKKVTEGDGSKDTFAPNKVCSRGHIVTFLYRAYK